MSSEDAFDSVERMASKLSHDVSSSLKVGGVFKLISFDVQADHKYHESVGRFSSYAKSGKSSSSESFHRSEKVTLEVLHGETLVFYQKCMSLMGIETCNKKSSLPIAKFEQKYPNKNACKDVEMQVDFMVEYVGNPKSIHCQATGCYISMISTSGAAWNTDAVKGGGEIHQIITIEGTDKVMIFNGGMYLGVDSFGHVVRQPEPYYWKMKQENEQEYSFQTRQGKYLSTVQKNGNPLSLMGDPYSNERFLINPL